LCKCSDETGTSFEFYILLVEKRQGSQENVCKMNRCTFRAVLSWAFRMIFFSRNTGLFRENISGFKIWLQGSDQPARITLILLVKTILRLLIFTTLWKFVKRDVSRGRGKTGLFPLHL